MMSWHALAGELLGLHGLAGGAPDTGLQVRILRHEPLQLRLHLRHLARNICKCHGTDVYVPWPLIGVLQLLR